MKKDVQRILALLALICFAGMSEAADSGCWFGHGASPVSTGTIEFQDVLVDRYFKIHYSAQDPFFHDSDLNQLPDVLERQISVLTRSRHFLQTILGWPVPATRIETGSPQLDVYFISAGKKFSGSVYQNKSLHLLLNKNVLSRSDFAAIWIHQFAHAAELMYRPSGEYWFYEATAGWMEGQFQSYSSATHQAQRLRFEHPEVPLTQDDPAFALGTSRFLELLARQVKDVVRQTWEQWSYTRDGRVMDVLENVLNLNHLPSLDVHLQNYYLMFPSNMFKEKNGSEIEIQPFAAALIRNNPNSDAGGIKLEFIPSTVAAYSTSTLYFPKGEKSGILAMKLGLSGNSSINIPFSGLDHFRYVLVNRSEDELHGSLHYDFDTAIPGSLEYFKASPEEEGVLLEWKTERENGVAFWNLYRVEDGQKEKLNDFPIPASIESSEGIHYIFFDSSSSAFYSLEAVTSDGFPSPVGNSEMLPQ